MDLICFSFLFVFMGHSIRLKELLFFAANMQLNRRHKTQCIWIKVKSAELVALVPEFIFTFFDPISGSPAVVVYTFYYQHDFVRVYT